MALREHFFSCMDSSGGFGQFLLFIASAADFQMGV